jgi:hypothetical protein
MVELGSSVNLHSLRKGGRAQQEGQGDREYDQILH